MLTNIRRSHLLLLGWGCGRRRGVEVDNSPLLDFCCFLAGSQGHTPKVHAEIAAGFFADAEPLADLLAHGGSPAAARHAGEAVVDEARNAASTSEHLVVRFTEQDAWAPESEAAGGTIGEASAESLHEPWIGHGTSWFCRRGHLAFFQFGSSFVSFFVGWIELVPSSVVHSGKHFCLVHAALARTQACVGSFTSPHTRVCVSSLVWSCPSLRWDWEGRIVHRCRKER